MESIGVPHFYTLAIIPVDVKNELVETDKVWSLEDEIEQAIVTGLLAMIYDEKLSILDNYLAEIVSDYPVRGQELEALENIGADKYATMYYRFNANTDSFQNLLDEYFENPERTQDEWRSFEKELSFDPEQFSIVIDLFMSEKGTEPDEELINKMTLDIERMKGLPRANYAIYMHDNFVDKTSGRGDKENSLIRGNPDLIIKE